MKSVIDILDLSVAEIDSLIQTACDMIDNPVKYSKLCEGKKIATLFFEPSTRTRLSFESAMLEFIIECAKNMGVSCYKLLTNAVDNVNGSEKIGFFRYRCVE